MVYISQNSNGASGFGMSGALYPTNMGGPFGNRNMQLPNDYQFPAKMFGTIKTRKKSRKTRKTRRKSRKTKRKSKK